MIQAWFVNYFGPDLGWVMIVCSVAALFCIFAFFMAILAWFVVQVLS